MILFPLSSVVDLASGTGKFTRLLVPLKKEVPFRLLAVEPVKEMREQVWCFTFDS